ncbi:MAG: hypothetical protein IT489_11625 [Gammaproteobacteria bacterium]|nr:hypothetical protein [Gammaproteobacteria bacterium]
MADEHTPSGDKTELGAVHSEWGRRPKDHFGYASEEERLAKRGLEDWELVNKIPESQKNVPVWFIAVILVVLLVAVGLSFPFWGDRPGYERSWFNWGFVIALVYIAVAATFVYFMVRLYGSHLGGRLDGDEEDDSGQADGQGHDKDPGH